MTLAQSGGTGVLGVPPGKERRKRHLNAGLNTARVLPGVEVEMYLKRGHKPTVEGRKAGRKAHGLRGARQKALGTPNQVFL